MSATISWRNTMSGSCPVVKGIIPKKPVIWHGNIWLTMPDGEKDTRSWISHQKITKDQAKEVLHALLSSLIAEHGNDRACDSGFTVTSR